MASNAYNPTVAEGDGLLHELRRRGFPRHHRQRQSPRVDEFEHQRVGPRRTLHELYGAWRKPCPFRREERLLHLGSARRLVGHRVFTELALERSLRVGGLPHRQVRALLDAGMTAMLCVGELLAEREAGRTAEVVRRQLTAALSGIEALAWDRLIIAYEPVWAIGTGRNATPADAAEVHREIRTVCAALGRVDRQPVLYGGSVNAACILALLAESEIDGVLVGGASLDADGWAGLVGFGA